MTNEPLAVWNANEVPVCFAIISAPRPKPTLSRSLLTMEKAGFSFTDGMVFSDGPCDLDQISVKRNLEHLGNKLNWHQAFRFMLLYTSYPWLMICEDDIEWCSDAASALEHDLRTTEWDAEVMCLSLYTPRRVTKGKPFLNSGYHHAGMQFGAKTWGAQCYVFRRDWAVKLFQDPRYQALIADKSKDKNIDAIVGQCINDMGCVIAYRIPCLVNHRMGAANSSLGYGAVRPDLETDHYKGYP